MPYGLKNAPAVFQKLMSQILNKCAEFATPYIDDRVIYSTSWRTHQEHVHEVLLRLREVGLTASSRKYR